VFYLKIEKLNARMVLDSRGNPTIEAEVYTGSLVASAMVPSGASTGSHEAMELRDKTKEFNGKNVTRAITKVKRSIAPVLKGLAIDDQFLIDETMIAKDGTHNKRNLGSNAILGVSMACARAGASSHDLSLHEYLGKLVRNNRFTLPVPYANVINGGEHCGNDLNFQEFMIVPYKAKSFDEAVRIVVEIYHSLKSILSQTFGPQATSIGDEGGFAPPISKPDEALELLVVAAKKAGHYSKIGFALDPAASEFYHKDIKKYEVYKDKLMSSDELVDYYADLVNEYKIISIEDPFHEDDFDAFAALTKRIGKKVQIVGDDLTVSNIERIKIAIQKKLCNALLLKVNQIGTVTEALDAVFLARNAGWNIMVSHRSGETEDPFIADLAVGIGCSQIKLGAPARGERTAKYNQLLRISSIYPKMKYGK
jgi:enolase